MNHVAVFNTQFLPYSQTFVYEELRQHQRYQADVFARHRRLSQRFPYESVHVGGPLYGYTRTSSNFDRIFEEKRFDLIHAHFGTGAVYAMRWAERFRLPLVVSFHGHDVTRLLSHERFHPKNWRYSLSHRKLFRQLTLALCASEELGELLQQIGLSTSKIRIHRLGVDLSMYERGPRSSNHLDVVMVGRFVEKKGFEYGLRAFAEASRNRSQLRLTVVGDGALGESLRGLAVELGVQGRVRFSGVLSPAEVAATLSQSHVLLAPSVVDRRGDRDSGLMVVKEASASHVVPIGSVHGGIPDIIDDEETGFLVRERDVAALSDRLGRLADDADKRERMASAARRKMEREYDNRGCVQRLEDYYDEAIAIARADG